jgi:hypothetical protein
VLAKSDGWPCGEPGWHSGGVLRESALAERAHQQDAEAEFAGERQDGPQFRWGDEASRLAILGTEAVSRVADTLPDGWSCEPPRRGGAVLMLHCMRVTRESLERRGGSGHD